MFCVLLEVFRRNAVVAYLGIARKLIIFLDNLLRRTAHLAFGAGAVETRLTILPTERLRFDFDRERDLEDLIWF